MSAQTVSIQGCARCGGEGHRDLIFLPLTFPHHCADGAVLTHWAPCPTNGEPILLGSIATEEASS